MTKPKPKPIPAPPEHLSERARGLWVEVVNETTKPARLALIEEALRALDRAGEAAAVLAREGLTVAPAGGKGMPHPHPLVRVERDSRAQFATIFSSLGLRW